MSYPPVGGLGHDLEGPFHSKPVCEICHITLAITFYLLARTNYLSTKKKLACYINDVGLGTESGKTLLQMVCLFVCNGDNCCDYIQNKTYIFKFPYPFV